MRTLAIGDIHGFPDTLNTLLDFVAPANDRLIFLGDSIDRGPDSRAVLEKLVELSANPNHVFLRGNHDEWLLQSRTEKSWFKSWLGAGVGGRWTLHSYGATTFWGHTQAMLQLIPESHWNFLERTRLFFETDTHIFVHASISGKPPEENTPEELLWPTFDAIKPHPSGKRIICGHTSQPDGLPADAGYAVCIDTFCSVEGWLTAFDVDSNEVFQANERGQTRQFALE